jgi:hypothetical protein
MNPTVGIFAGCCARAASGQVATPISSPKNSRRFMMAPKRASYHTGNLTGQNNGFERPLRDGDRLYSKERTSATADAMSVFVPEANMAMRPFDHLVGASKNVQRDDRYG